MSPQIELRMKVADDKNLCKNSKQFYNMGGPHCNEYNDKSMNELYHTQEMYSAFFVICTETNVMQ